MLQEVLRNLVKRYVAAMIRDAKTEEGLTEENFKVGRFTETSVRFKMVMESLLKINVFEPNIWSRNKWQS